MRVVLDTNVLISALLFKGRLSRVYEAIEYRELTLCFTETTFDEFRGVLWRKKFELALRRQHITVEEVITFVYERSFTLKTPSSIPNIITEDMTDNHLLIAAVAGNAVCLVSGDKHLLRLGVFEDIPILTPKQFLETL